MESKDKYGKNTSHIYYIRLVRWQQRAEWRITCIIFAETYRREERETFENRPIVLKNSVLNETDPYAIQMVNILNKSSVYICH